MASICDHIGTKSNALFYNTERLYEKKRIHIKDFCAKGDLLSKNVLRLLLANSFQLFVVEQS
jgi:hypothetical protein